MDVGPVSAWLDASIDVFVQFKPFHYTADFSVSVGCAITIKVWFVRVRIAASVGATVHIEGPDPFGGVSPGSVASLGAVTNVYQSAHVDFYLFGFTIDFGPQPKPAPGVELPVFYEMVHTPGPAPLKGGSESDQTDPMMARLKFTLTGGIVPQRMLAEAPASPDAPFPDTGAGKPWNVKPGTFSFSIECDFALSAAELQEGEDENLTSHAITLPGGNTALPAIFSKPMHLGLNQAIDSKLEITVWLIDSEGDRVRVPGFRGLLDLKKVPTAM